MRWIKLTNHTFEKNRQALIRFFKRHGDKRITKVGFNWLRRAERTEASKEGNFMLCAVENGKLAGVLIIVNYGIDESFTAVHKQYRNQDIAHQLVQQAISELGKLYGRVAIDNIPSLKICLDNDMVAFHLFTGPTGKPTLWLGGGDWRREDVL